MKDILMALWFFVPAGIANAAPVLANKVPVFNRWNTPIDFGLKWRGKRLLGDNKRVRGLVAGAMVAMSVIVLQELWFNHSAWIRSISYINYNSELILGVGILLGVGALIGDAVESFFKRRVGVKAGHSWFPFDQLDYIAGGLFFVTFLIQFSAQQYLWIFAVWFGMHIIVSYIGYLLKLKDRPI